MNTLPLVATLLAGLAATTSQAAPPSVVSINPGYSFAEYTGAAAVGRGDVDIDSTLFYIDEKVAGSWKSWYLFFDPGQVQDLTATIHFDQPIHAVLTTKTGLDATNATYGIDIDGDSSFDDYGTSLFIGLEGRDTVSWLPGGQNLKVNWNAIDPGDHIRVLVAVPEPASYLLFGAGLLALGPTLRRRRG